MQTIKRKSILRVADGYGFHPISKFGKRSIPELTGCAAGHVDACWL
ncbi:hypothetical protein BIFPSEUDO_03831 [Bifidobacterium pseudocatenulatum DSM 20438 = JCM 1200 = LMG 10505]|uniref:Uncharacterized protein n=1 Tax=Bifidobacterium pseudocatenulatum DSM 20438 = JCM 1200 = LMG 10505 TaxID=547043 RepID=C0BTU9_BIFPS|nr:hypothetical protein BIFPSEUDO_03831 [Bifidobacterium pseudocatenulatum DSM 20438 = JCM 1200 = LMG 10505]BAR03728.1 hypothetical protein BBPC_1050 [Bifidobacterium pseudocatenulatum DSM 20438 = JCM 1200 = LMG 10505]